ncbi:hypothetical protein Agabi119p4_7049 [Agaricus bisporus var. burnettii]|uniref:Uncharacterized protein n=1 Tax=Agaricus bisporus var. burnettii TaxID=192524 RepID=A0A8H7F0R0_AGABI|nr:hypothetical protein Agabi119p4_7049 [Agaricus bisporus var. burnettii]
MSFQLCSHVKCTFRSAHVFFWNRSRFDGHGHQLEVCLAIDPLEVQIRRACFLNWSRPGHAGRSRPSKLLL